MSDIFNKVEQVIEAIEAASPATAEELEQFRIQYLGSKNTIKPLFGEIRNVPNERKKEYGQLVNKAKVTAENKFAELKESLEAAADVASASALDLTMPGDPMPLGSRHPVAVTMNRIVTILQRMGFAVVEGPEIEDDWHNFTAMNTPEDHPARDMQDTFYLKKQHRTIAPYPYLAGTGQNNDYPQTAYPGHRTRKGLSERDDQRPLACSVPSGGRAICGRGRQLCGYETDVDVFRTGDVRYTENPPASQLLPVHRAKCRNGRLDRHGQRKKLPPLQRHRLVGNTRLRYD